MSAGVPPFPIEHELAGWELFWVLLEVVEGAEELLVVTRPADFEAVREALRARGFAAASAEVTMQPSTTVALQGKEADTMLSLAEALEDLDDVQNLYSNFDVSEEELAKRA